MIIYNVTLAVEPTIEVEFITWLKEIHIPEVMDCGLFLDWSLFKVMETPQGGNSNSFAVQYKLESWTKLELYQKEFAPSLQKKTQDKFGESVLGFRTFLEEV